MAKFAEAKRYALCVEIDACELAVRMLEAAGRLKRPVGLTAGQAFRSLDQQDQDAWMRAATSAITYFRDCINASQQPS